MAIKKKYLNILFAELNKNDTYWLPNKPPAFPWMFEYDLPVIGYSLQEIKRNDSWFDDYLGKYVALDAEWEKEGRIVLYLKSIERIAKPYALEKQISISECKQNITTIVLLHEIGHWILHHMPTDETGRNKKYKIFSRNFKEPVAQFFVRIAIRDDSELEKLFYWMIEQQEDVYQLDLSSVKTNDNAGLNSVTDTLQKLSIIRNRIEKKDIEVFDIELYKIFIFEQRGYKTGKNYGL